MTDSLNKQIKNLNTIIENNRQQVRGSFSSLKDSVTPLKIIATVVGGACFGYFLFTRRAKFINPIIKKGSQVVKGLVNRYPTQNVFRLGLLNALMLVSGFFRYMHLARGFSSLLASSRKTNKSLPFTPLTERTERVTLH